ncbi:unnamed protein product, partial [Rotaria sordida]
MNINPHSNTKSNLFCELGQASAFQIARRITDLSSSFVPGQQEDPSEFLIVLLNRFMQRISSNDNTLFSTYLCNPLHSIFGINVKSSITCTSCQIQITKKNYETIWSIPIVSYYNLKEALVAFCSKEKLTGDNAFPCSQCHSKTTALQSLQLANTSSIIIIHLKRFIYDQKNNLDLIKYRTESRIEIIPKKNYKNQYPDYSNSPDTSCSSLSSQLLPVPLTNKSHISFRNDSNQISDEATRLSRLSKISTGSQLGVLDENPNEQEDFHIQLPSSFNFKLQPVDLMKLQSIRTNKNYKKEARLYTAMGLPIEIDTTTNKKTIFISKTIKTNTINNNINASYDSDQEIQKKESRVDVEYLYILLPYIKKFNTYCVLCVCKCTFGQTTKDRNQLLRCSLYCSGKPLCSFNCFIIVLNNGQDHIIVNNTTVRHAPGIKISRPIREPIRNGKVTGAIQLISKHPSKIIIFTETAIRLFDSLIHQKDITISWDATGAIIREQNNSPKYLYYELTITLPGVVSEDGLIPISSMISSSHSLIDIIHWLELFKHHYSQIFVGKEFPKPKLILSDRAQVFLCAALKVWNNEKMQDFLDRSYRIVNGDATNEDLKLTNIHACMAHVLIDTRRTINKFIIKEYREIAIWSIALLINSCTWIEFKYNWKIICLVFLEIHRGEKHTKQKYQDILLDKIRKIKSDSNTYSAVKSSNYFETSEL